MVKASESLGWLVSIAEFSRGAESPQNLTAKRPRAEHSPQVGLAAGVTQHLVQSLVGPRQGSDSVFLLLLFPQCPNPCSRVIQSSNLAAKQKSCHTVRPHGLTQLKRHHRAYLGQLWVQQSNFCLWFVCFLSPSYSRCVHFSFQHLEISGRERLYSPCPGQNHRHSDTLNG